MQSSSDIDPPVRQYCAAAFAMMRQSELQTAGSLVAPSAPAPDPAAAISPPAIRSMQLPSRQARPASQSSSLSHPATQRLVVTPAVPQEGARSSTSSARAHRAVGPSAAHSSGLQGRVQMLQVQLSSPQGMSEEQ